MVRHLQGQEGRGCGIGCLADNVGVDGKRTRPYETVLPLSGDLGLDVDLSCDRDDPKCVKDAVEDYDGDGNILIW